MLFRDCFPRDFQSQGQKALLLSLLETSDGLSLRITQALDNRIIDRPSEHLWIPQPQGILLNLSVILRSSAQFENFEDFQAISALRVKTWPVVVSMIIICLCGEQHIADHFGHPVILFKTGIEDILNFLCVRSLPSAISVCVTRLVWAF